MDFEKYHEWFLTMGSSKGRPLDEDTWIEDRRKLAAMARDGLDLDALTVEQARAYVVRRRRELKAGSANNLSKALMRLLHFRLGEAVKLPMWKEEEPAERALTGEQKFAAVGYVHPDARVQLRRRFVAGFALASGVEPAEASPLDERDFDLERGGVHIDHPCKGHRRRFVPLPKSVLSAPNRPSFVVWMRKRDVPKDDRHAVFTGRSRSRAGESERVVRLAPAALSRDLQVVAEQTRVPINWQVTRHTWATDLLHAGFSPRYIQKLAGWHGIDQLLTYAEAPQARVESEFRKLKGLDPFR